MSVNVEEGIEPSDTATPLTMSPLVSAEEAVTATLRNAIREGVLPPGQRLTQAEIANQLGVSRIPLRDALRRLSAESLVEIDGHNRARVTVLTAEDVTELYEMRILLEGRCMAHAVNNLSEDAAKRLSELAVASEADDLTPGESFNRRRAFYSELYRFAERPRMRRTILQLRDNVDRYHLLADREHAQSAHNELAEAIAARKGEQAAQVLLSHISESRDDLVRELQPTD